MLTAYCIQCSGSSFVCLSGNSSWYPFWNRIVTYCCIQTGFCPFSMRDWSRFLFCLKCAVLADLVHERSSWFTNVNYLSLAWPRRSPKAAERKQDDPENYCILFLVFKGKSRTSVTSVVGLFSPRLNSPLTPMRCITVSLSEILTHILRLGARVWCSFLCPGKKPYICDVCGKAFSRKGHIKGHIAAVHDGTCLSI